MPIQEFDSQEEMDASFEDLMDGMEKEGREQKEADRISMIEPTGVLDWSLTIECPKCNEDLDLSSGDYNSDGCISTPIFNNKWDDLKGLEIQCACCEHDFYIKEVVY